MFSIISLKCRVALAHIYSLALYIYIPMILPAGPAIKRCGICIRQCQYENPSWIPTTATLLRGEQFEVWCPLPERPGCLSTILLHITSILSGNWDTIALG